MPFVVKKVPNPFKQLGLIIAAGGSSSRFGKDNKLFQMLNGLPVFCHCLKNFLAGGIPDACLLVVPENSRNDFLLLLDRHLPSMTGRIQIIPGGKTRTDSVLAGLNALPESCLFVAVQDAARPLSDANLLLRCLDSARTFGSGIAARRLNDTIKQAGPDGKVLQTLDRNSLWAAETPQVFQRKILLKAYQHCRNSEKNFTDDAQLLEECGIPVQLVENPKPNPKITFPEDLANLTGTHSCNFHPGIPNIEGVQS